MTSTVRESSGARGIRELPLPVTRSLRVISNEPTPGAPEGQFPCLASLASSVSLGGKSTSPRCRPQTPRLDRSVITGYPLALCAPTSANRNRSTPPAATLSLPLGCTGQRGDRPTLDHEVEPPPGVLEPDLPPAPAPVEPPPPPAPPPPAPVPALAPCPPAPEGDVGSRGSAWGSKNITKSPNTPAW